MNKPFSRANLKCDIVLHFVWFLCCALSLHWISKCVSVLFVCVFCVHKSSDLRHLDCLHLVFAFEWSRRLYAQTMRHKKRSNRLYLQSLQPHVAFAWLCNWFIWMKRWKKRRRLWQNETWLWRLYNVHAKEPNIHIGSMLILCKMFLRLKLK